MTPFEMARDAQLAKVYWATRESKAFAVEVVARDVKKITYKRTIYVRASDEQRARDWVKANRSMFGLPRVFGSKARLAGPMELGAVPAPSEVSQ